MLQSKYAQATSFLQKKMKKEKEDYIADSSLTTAVNACFAQIPATRGFKKFG